MNFVCSITDDIQLESMIACCILDATVCEGSKHGSFVAREMPSGILLEAEIQNQYWLSVEYVPQSCLTFSSL